MLAPRYLVLVNFLSVYLIWGSTYVLMKTASIELHPFAVIFWQNIIAAFVLIFFNRKKEIFKYLKVNFREILIQSVLMLICGVGFITIAVSKVSPALASIIISSVPLWVALFTMLDTRTIQSRKMIGVIFGFVGIILLANSSEIKSHALYLLLLVIASFSWSLGLYRSRRLSNLSDPYLTSIGQLLIASMVYFGYFCITRPILEILPVQGVTISSLIGLGVLGDAIAFTSFIWLLKNVEPLLVSTYAYVNPVVSIFLSWLVFDETFDANKLAIISLILLSVMITVTDRDRKVVYEQN